MNIPKSCRRPAVSLLYATKSAFTAPNLCWACALASSVIFLRGDHVMQIGFGQISPSASSTRDLGTRLSTAQTFLVLVIQYLGKQKPKTSIIARTSAKAVDSLYARISLRTRRSKSVNSGFVQQYQIVLYE